MYVLLINEKNFFVFVNNSRLSTTRQSLWSNCSLLPPRRVGTDSSHSLSGTSLLVSPDVLPRSDGYSDRPPLPTLSISTRLPVSYSSGTGPTNSPDTTDQTISSSTYPFLVLLLSEMSGGLPTSTLLDAPLPPNSGTKETNGRCLWVSLDECEFG